MARSKRKPLSNSMVRRRCPQCCRILPSDYTFFRYTPQESRGKPERALCCDCVGARKARRAPAA